MALLEGDWKFYLGYDGKMRELYDVGADASETRNVADQHPDLTGRFVRVLQEWNSAMPADAGGASFGGDNETRARANP
jgi:hypothetical protein